MNVFILKPEHIKLLRAAYVDWDDCEFGAPCINPKRPYGNSSVLLDIHEILTGGSCEDELTQEQEDRYSVLHGETATALQVILSAGSFEPGVYVRDNPYGDEWRKS